MPNKKITEFIDEKAFAQFTKLKLELTDSQSKFAELIKTASKFNDEIGRSGSIDEMEKKMQSYNSVSEKVAETSDRLTKKYREAREAQDKVVEATERNIKASQEAAGALLDNNAAFDKSIKIQARLAVEHKRMRSDINRLRKTIGEMGDKTGKLTDELADLEKKDALVNEQLKATSTEVRRRAKIMNETSDSNLKASLTLDQLRDDYKRLSQEQKDNEKIGGEYLKRINELDAQLKQTEASQGIYNRSVGDYTRASGEAVDVLNQLFPQLSTVTGAFQKGTSIISGTVNVIKSYVGGQEAATAATKASTVATKSSSVALKVLRAALISTGIGALVVALGSLIAYLTTSQKGIDALTKVTRPLQAVFSRVVDIASRLGEILVNAFKNPKQAVKDLWETIKNNFVNRLKSLGVVFKAINKIISSGFREGYKDLSNGVIQMTTGVENSIDKVTDAAKRGGKEIADAWRLGKAKDELIREIEEIEIAQTTLMGKLQRGIQEQRNLARDASISDTERRDAAQKAVELINQQETERNKLVQKRIDLVRLEQKIAGEATRESRKELAELQAEQDENAAKAEQQRGRVLRSDNSLAKSMQKNIKDTSDAQAKADEERQKRIEDLIVAQTKLEDVRNRQSLEIYRTATQSGDLDERLRNLEFFANKQNEIIENQFAEEARLARNKFKDDQDRLDVELQLIAEKRKEAGINAAEEIKKVQDDILGGVNGGDFDDTQLKEQLAAQLITREEYEKQRFELAFETNQKILADEIATVEKIIAANKKLGLDTANSEKTLADLKKQMSDEATDHVIANNEKELERQKELHAKQKELYKELGNLAMSLIQGRMDKRLEELEVEAENIEFEKESRINAINAEGGTEEERQQRIAVAEQKALIQHKKIEDEKRRIKQKQARFDRLASIGQIIQNTAQGVMSALAMFPPNVPLSVTIGAIGAAQLAQVLAQPIPKFATGTNYSPEGLAIWGEKGSELFQTPGGDIGLSPGKASLTNLEKGTKIIPADETRRILARESLKVDTAGSTFDLYRMMRDNKEQTDRVIKAITGNKTPTTILTKRGLRNEHFRNKRLMQRLKNLI